MERNHVAENGVRLPLTILDYMFYEMAEVYYMYSVNADQLWQSAVAASAG